MLILPMPVLWSSALVLQALCQQLSKLVSRALDSADLISASPLPSGRQAPPPQPSEDPPPSLSSNERPAAGGAPGIVIDGGAWQDCWQAEKGRLQGSRKPGSGREPSGERRGQPVISPKCNICFPKGSSDFFSQTKHKRLLRRRGLATSIC